MKNETLGKALVIATYVILAAICLVALIHFL